MNSSAPVGIAKNEIRWRAALSFSRCWQRFGRSRRVRTLEPGVREAWHQGRRWYHVWVVLLADAEVEARMEQIRRVLDLAPSAPGQPHVTVWVRGFEAGNPHPQEGARIPLQIGGVNSFLSCPFLEVRSREIFELRRGFGDVEERWSPYLPHLTLGRYHRSEPCRRIASLLHPFRGLPPLPTSGILAHVRVNAFSEEGSFERVG